MNGEQSGELAEGAYPVPSRATLELTSRLHAGLRTRDSLVCVTLLAFTFGPTLWKRPVVIRNRYVPWKGEAVTITWAMDTLKSPLAAKALNTLPGQPD